MVSARGNAIFWLLPLRGGAASAELCDERLRAAPRSSGSATTSTRSTPSSGWTAAVTSVVMRSFSGQPSIVMQHVDADGAAVDLDVRSMPMSSIGRPISGSITLRSASRT